LAETSVTADPTADTISNYATAIGMLTIYWAALENSLLTVIERLLETDQLTADSVGTSIEKAAARAALIQRLVRRPGKAPSAEWVDCVAGMCEQISNNLGPARNRLIHDEWNVSETYVTRINRSVKIGKMSAHSAKTLLSNKATPSHVTEIYELTSKVVHTMLHLSMLVLQYPKWRKTGEVPRVPEQAIQLSQGQAPSKPILEQLKIQRN
jgi:hypothetical protein